MKKLYSGLTVLLLLFVLVGCGNKRKQVDPNENVIELATDSRARAADTQDGYTLDSGDNAAPGDGEPSEPDNPDATPTPEQEASKYYYLKEDGSVGLCDYNEVEYHKQETEATNDELDGKLKETLDAISRMEGKEIPELTDALVKKYYDYKSVDELKEVYRQMIEESKSEKAEDAYKNEILSYIVDNSSFKSDLTEMSCTYYASLYSYYNTQAVSKDMSFGDYVLEAYGMTEEAFKRRIADDATELACRTEVLLAIAEAENIVIDEEMYNLKLQGYMAKFGYTDREKFEKEYSRDVIEFNMLQDLAFEYVLENAKSM